MEILPARSFGVISGPTTQTLQGERIYCIPRHFALHFALQIAISIYHASNQWHKKCPTQNCHTKNPTQSTAYNDTPTVARKTIPPYTMTYTLCKVLLWAL